MLTKPLIASVLLAALCVLSASTAHAQSYFNAMPWYGATPSYAPANCPNGNCAATRSSYYGPTYNGYAQSPAYRSTGNCSGGACATGACAKSPCVNGVCYGNARSTNYAPVNPAYQTYYRAPMTTNPAWPATNGGYPNSWPNGYAPRMNPSFNSLNSPFYP